ncbi:DUF2726 domain-containing protein [Geobacter sp. FeAm09]|uniref:DUF2726 domain-containing protein n=1 Tax=Geobacter sp. FeAm09 TaxID=2597769 RepID=UPI0011F030C2|nr:DUF2726 domain-containing protein [Geobacter sp. FeAm09]QEM68564.1 DUF2726 domain-containing protein [Geobacter sp. FeAm09]
MEMVIELDDSTHQQAKRIARDEFLEAALEAAHVPIARFPVKRAYTLRELQAKLGDFVVSAQEPDKNKAVDVERAEPEPMIIKPVLPTSNEKCSKCGSEMKIREKKSGEETGKKFLVCIKYPECRTVEPYAEARWF